MGSLWLQGVILRSLEVSPAEDHIVIGSRGAPTLRRCLGSVSSEMVAQATGTVTVVKTPPEREAAERPEGTHPLSPLDNRPG